MTAGKDSVCVLDIEVRFAETDLMGVVHHASYIVWLEAGRVAWMSQAGLPYVQIFSAGYNFAVTDIHCRYRTAIHFGDPVQVITRLVGLRSRQVEFGYEVVNSATGVVCAAGSSRHICVDRVGAMTRIPDWVVTGLTGND
ncbi:MAG: acyl-CoA thioesterase [Caldilineaceae bacterium]|nr:acyl-CoA thioesterase [Caldilineaceae bacterium]HRJ42809.1 thioesterase family protein [Caldilineaceae bacterium]